MMALLSWLVHCFICFSLIIDICQWAPWLVLARLCTEFFCYIVSFFNADVPPECSTLRVPKIRNIFGVIGMLKLLAGFTINLFFEVVSNSFLPYLKVTTLTSGCLLLSGNCLNEPDFRVSIHLWSIFFKRVKSICACFLCWSMYLFRILIVHVSSSLLGSYLIVITERECVGSYMGHPIFKISSLKILHCNHALQNSPAEQVNSF